ncbi:unnamed protein product [Rangifer tarandus platyrhynchus]|uniref:Uncharacterized protein n=1 Tax=Rangifer tarandus platyrhynchus TaxID=3082113 RepID=A0ABN8ZDF6_RANTA|nr:unnamed protein product [Rangifer tarandus platyrhynchus]
MIVGRKDGGELRPSALEECCRCQSKRGETGPPPFLVTAAETGSVWGSLCPVNCRPRLAKDSLVTVSVAAHDL